MRKFIIVFLVLFIIVPLQTSALLVAPPEECPPGLIGTFPNCTPGPPPTPDPVVIVPGIVGSWNWDVLLHDGTGGTWDFTPFTNVYQPLVDALRSAFTSKALNPDKNVFIAFYDWRQPNVLSAQDYLKPVIEEAKQESGKDKVDIIAHSMGGILARAYIQGVHYQNDVDQLFTLGSPHYGSSDVYAPWEGGRIPDNWELVQKTFFKTYLFWKGRAILDRARYDVIHVSIPSIRDLLPTYDYLKEQGTGNIKSTATLQEQNITLNTFNNTIANLSTLVGSITTIAGNDQGTVGEIPVVSQNPNEDPLWKDGKPDPIDPTKNSSEGDNRVLLSSAHIQNIVDQVTLANAKHADLPSKAGSELFPRLGFSDPGQLALVDQPEDILSFMFASPVLPTVTAPDGSIAKDSNTIPGAIYFGEDDPQGLKMILIPNPQEGEYQVDLLGNGNGHYDFASAYFKENTPDNLQTFSGEITNGQVVSYASTLLPCALETLRPIRLAHGGESTEPQAQGDSECSPLESELTVTHESLKQTIKHFLSIGMIKKKAFADGLIALVNAHQKTSNLKTKSALKKSFETTVLVGKKTKLITSQAADLLIAQIIAL